MKKCLLIFIVLLICESIFAQSPGGFKYQAVIKNSEGNPLSEQSIALKASILQSSVTGNAVYSEEHGTQTNSEGLVNLVIGEGSILSGDFSTIPWESGPFFLKLEIDADGGNNYTEIGTSQLLSVPYALFSEKSKTVTRYNSDTLFVVKDTLGNPVFAVFPDGAKVFVNEYNPKGPIGGFAVSGRNNTKGEYEVMRVTPDSTRIYVNDAQKGPIGGFAVSGRNNTKAGEYEVMRVTPDGTTIYVNDNTLKKGPIGGFAVSGRNNTKGEYEVMKVTPDSTRIYLNKSGKGPIGGFAVSGRNNTKGTLEDVFHTSPDSTRIYVNQLTNSTGGFKISGRNSNQTTQFLDLTPDNYFIGHESGQNIESAIYNSTMGYQAGKNIKNSDNNVFIGNKAGISDTSGRFNVFIGSEAGIGNTDGKYNIYLGHRTAPNINDYFNTIIGAFATEETNYLQRSSIIGGYAANELDTCTESVLIGDMTGRTGNWMEKSIMIGTGVSSFGYDSRKDVVIGHRGLERATSGSFGNTLLGCNTALNATYANQNVFVGMQAGKNAENIERNVVLGYQAGYNLNGNNNVLIGYLAGYNLGSVSNQLVITNQSPYVQTPLISGDFELRRLRIDTALGIGRIPAVNQLEVDGEASKTTAGSWLANSDKRIKTDISNIEDAKKILNQLRPVKFRYTDEYLKKHPGIKDHFYYNFIAQEYKQVFPESVKKSGEFLKGGEEILQLDTYNANIIAVKAVQELIKENKELKNELKNLKNRIQKIEKLIQ